VNWAFDDFQISSLCPCDISYWVKKLSSLSIKDSQDAMTRFVRSFQITMRASKPYARCATQSRSQTLVPVTGGTTQLGFGSPLTNPLRSVGFVPGTVTPESELLFINNRGTAPNRPLLVVYGAISNFSIVNLTNNQQINWSYALLDGDYLLFDCANRTLVNSTGTNMKAYLNVSVPQWMWFEPGWNDIYIMGSNYSANTKLVSFFRSAYM
jgi:hypothetical protein